MRRPRIPALTGVRALPALVVMLSHGTTSLTGHPIAWVGAVGNAAMSVFFVLSGFILVHRYGHLIERPTVQGLRSFYVARAARLYPAYVLLLALGLVWSDHITAGGAVAHLTLTQTWFVLEPPGGVRLIDQFPFAAIAWSISTEWFFYLMFPVLCLTAFRLSGRLALLCAAAFVAGQLVVGSVAQATWTGEPTTIGWLTYLSPYLRIAEFAAGGLLARFALAAPTERLPWLLPASLGVLAAFVVGFSLPGCPEWLYRLRVSGAYVIPAALFIYYSYTLRAGWSTRGSCSLERSATHITFSMS